MNCLNDGIDQFPIWAGCLIESWRLYQAISSRIESGNKSLHPCFQHTVPPRHNLVPRTISDPRVYPGRVQRIFNAFQV